MAIVIMGTFRLEPGEAIKAAQMLADHAASVRHEQGCEAYSFAFDAGDPDLVRVAERWASVEALMTHISSDEQKAFGRALRVHGPSATRIDGWDGAFWRNLVGG